ncbi:hypothetical protein FKP32DRAFT_941195 [Trametes sanguinea]|nr:hypothetical protein FKP32DRAFT_941195 [Trametes sanguinea]
MNIRVRAHGTIKPPLAGHSSPLAPRSPPSSDAAHASASAIVEAYSQCRVERSCIDLGGISSALKARKTHIEYSASALRRTPHLFPLHRLLLLSPAAPSQVRRGPHISFSSRRRRGAHSPASAQKPRRMTRVLVARYGKKPMFKIIRDLRSNPMHRAVVYVAGVVLLTLGTRLFFLLCDRLRLSCPACPGGSSEPPPLPPTYYQYHEAALRLPQHHWQNDRPLPNESFFYGAGHSQCGFLPRLR